MNNDLIYAYTAGIIDGEGTISIQRRRRKDYQRVPIVSVSSTTHELLKFLQDNYSGCIRNQKTYKEHHKPSWVWSVTHNRALSLIEKILPYMLEPNKVYRANLLLSGYKKVTPRNGQYTEEMLAAKLAFEHSFFNPNITLAE